MKKIISLLIMFLLMFNVFIVDAYNIDEGASTIKTVISKLDGSDYTFKYNEGSSAKASYYVFYKGNMIGYIYSTDDGITLGDGWDSNGELGIFFNQKDLTVDEIVDRFYTDKDPLAESDSLNKIYSCSGDSKEFFSCLSKNTSKGQDSEGLIYLFGGDVKKDILIKNGDVIKYESIDNNGIKKECEIENEKKSDFLAMLSRWEEGAFSNKDFDYALCSETVIGKGNLNTNIDFGDLSNLASDGTIGLINNNSLINKDGTIDFDINNLVNSNILTNQEGINTINTDVSNTNNSLNNTSKEITYQDGLDIINNTNKRLKNIDKSIEDDSLYEKMMMYRKMWNNIKLEDEKKIPGVEGLRIKYLYKKIEEKYKKLFKEYVLSIKNNNLNKNSTDNKSNNNLNKNNDINNIENKGNNIEVEKDINIIKNKDFQISDKLLNNFKTLFILLNKKYYKDGNFTNIEKNRMNSLFTQVDKNKEFSSIDDFLGKDSSFLNNEYNIDLLQKLMIIMCSK